MLAARLRLPLPAEPTITEHQPDTIDAEVSEDWPDIELTRYHVDLPRALRQLLGLVSQTETLANAAVLAIDDLAAGPTETLARRGQRIADLMTATRAAALRALEAAEALVTDAGAASAVSTTAADGPPRRARG